MATFDFEKSHIIIWDYAPDPDEDDGSQYNFRAADYEYQPSPVKATDLQDISDSFWEYVPSSQEKWLKQKLLKTVFDSH